MKFRGLNIVHCMLSHAVVLVINSLDFVFNVCLIHVLTSNSINIYSLIVEIKFSVFILSPLVNMQLLQMCNAHYPSFKLLDYCRVSENKAMFSAHKKMYAEVNDI